MTTYRKRPTVTIEQAWQWLGNRGMGVAKRNIKVRGRWALVRTSYEGDGWDSEVECYNVLSGSIYAEPWSDIKYKDSPFVPNNEERTEIALTKIEQSYLDQDSSEMEGLCLIAIQGDMAQGGMGTHNYVYPFEPKHHKLVKKYMEAQLAFHMACQFQRDLRETQNSQAIRRERAKIGKLCMAELDAGHALRDAGVFRSKYDQRTTWEIANMSELDEFKRYQPYVVIPFEEGE